MASAPGRARDDRDPAVDDDEPVEELVQRAHLGARRRVTASDVLVRGGAPPGGVLVERAHLEPALEGRDVALARRWPGAAAVRAALRLGGEQLALGVGDHRGDEADDGVEPSQLGERTAAGRGRASPGLREGAEASAPTGADSLISSAPRWLIGATTRDCTDATGRPGGSAWRPGRAAGDRASTSRSKRRSQVAAACEAAGRRRPGRRRRRPPRRARSRSRRRAHGSAG